MIKTSMKVRAVIEVDVPGLGKEIWKARKLNDKSLAQILREVGMSSTNWYKIESEETKALPIDTLRKIEEVLGVDLGVVISQNFKHLISA